MFSLSPLFPHVQTATLSLDKRKQYHQVRKTTAALDHVTERAIKAKWTRFPGHLNSKDSQTFALAFSRESNKIFNFLRNWYKTQILVCLFTTSHKTMYVSVWSFGCAKIKNHYKHNAKAFKCIFFTLVRRDVLPDFLGNQGSTEVEG
jgi:hypothetical protein